MLRLRLWIQISLIPELGRPPPSVGFGLVTLEPQAPVSCFLDEGNSTEYLTE